MCIYKWDNLVYNFNDELKVKRKYDHAQKSK